ncbi:MAG: hypothetical protein LKE41_00980 [Prevotella sp.]|jgi:hypothetical protein|nr:hypothetical protein [Prevotella sp.]
MIDVRLYKTAKKDSSSRSVVSSTVVNVQKSAEALKAGYATKAGKADTADTANYANKAGQASRANYADKAGEIDESSEALTKFLRKDKDDSTPFKLGMGEAEVKGDLTVGGHVATDDIHSSDSDGNTAMTGRGWTLKNVKDASGSYSVLAVDNIVVRKKIEAAELEIHKKIYVGAQMIASDWGHKVIKVEPIYADFANHTYSPVGLTLFTLPVNVNGAVKYVTFVGKALSDTETRVELLGDDKGILNRELETSANAFKVYFCESDGTAAIKDDLVVGSMAQVQEFNVKSRVTHNFTNSYYWGVCVAHGVEENVMIGGKATSCIYGVFAHTTDMISLTSEANGKAFSCYGMEQAGCTFPVVGDDMVGFGCADPYQDSDRGNAIVIASKDGENSAPSVIGYSGIGRKRAGKEREVTEDPMPDYANIGEQYSLPSAKDDSRLDFRLSKKAGNVFKGDIYFRGKDGNLQPVSDTVTYTLALSRTVVAAGQSVDVEVYQISAKDMKALTTDEIKSLGLSLVLDFGGAADSKSLPLWSNTTLTYNTIHPVSGMQSVGLSLMKEKVLLATASLSFIKETEQTKVVRLIPVGEWAVVDFSIVESDLDSRYGGDTERNTSVFTNTLNVSLSYNLLIQTGNGAPDRYTSLPEEYDITVKILYPNGVEKLSENKTGSHFSRSKLVFNYSDKWEDLYNVSAYIYVILTDSQNGLTVYDKRCIPVKLNNSGVFRANEKMLSYIYYGTDGKSGMSFTNKRVTTMEGNYSELSSWKDTADGKISQNTTKISETAEGLQTEVSKREESEKGIKENVSKIEQKADDISASITNGLKSVGFDMSGSDWSVRMWGDKYIWYATEDDANNNTNPVMWLDTTTKILHIKGHVEALSGNIGGLELNGKEVSQFSTSPGTQEEIRSAMSPHSLQFYISHSDGRWSIVTPVSWTLQGYSGSFPGNGLSSITMKGYGDYIPAYSAEIKDANTPKEYRTMVGLGVGFCTNGRVIGNVLQSLNGGLAMVAMCYGTVNANGTLKSQQLFSVEKNCSVMSVSKLKTGTYYCSMYTSPAGYWTVLVSAINNPGPMYASLYSKSSSGFTVVTADDSTQNDSDFEFIIVSFGGM